MSFNLLFCFFQCTRFLNCLPCKTFHCHTRNFLTTVRPLTVEIKKPATLGEGGVLTAERRYEVACESAGSRPPALVTWYKGKRQLKRITVSFSAQVYLIICSFYVFLEVTTT